MNWWQRLWHEHHYSYQGSDRLKILHTTYLVSIYHCWECNDVKSMASNFEPYLKMFAARKDDLENTNPKN